MLTLQLLPLEIQGSQRISLRVQYIKFPLQSAFCNRRCGSILDCQAMYGGFGQW
jgi:hypothetical protein